MSELSLVSCKFHDSLFRFGLGLILQAKVQLLAPAPDEHPPRRRSLIRRISSRLFRRRTTRRRSSSTAYGRGETSGLDEICEEPSQEEPLSPALAKSSSLPVPFHGQLTRHITRLFSQPDDLPKPETKPRYNTASFHQFMGDTFPGAVKLEEHQVNIKTKEN